MKPNHLVFAALLSCASSLSFAIGAIAVDDQVGEEEPGYGYSTGHKTQAQAEKAAAKECRKHGNDNCKVIVWFKECGAYAASRKYYGYGWGDTSKAAERAALKMCARNSCEVKVSQCEDE